MKAYLRIAALAFGASMLPAAAQAAPITYFDVLSGLNEVPAVASPGSGAAWVTIDTAVHTLRVQFHFSDLLAPTTAAHIHVGAAPGVNGPVATQTPYFAGFPLGVTSGSFDATFDLTLSSSYNGAFITANGGSVAAAEAALALGLAEGRAYLNVHSAMFPGGEIRANLAAVPEPASWALMIGGFALAGAALRSRRKVEPSLA